MTHAEETWRMWQRVQQNGAAYDRWSAFFVSLIDDPETAQALCEMGMKMVRRELVPSAATRLQIERIMAEAIMSGRPT